MSIRRFFSTGSEATPPTETEVLDLVSDEADEAFEALSSETARKTLARLYEEPGAASDLAAELDLSLQNVNYHLNQLREADLIEVAGTKYSDTGNEMKVYSPTRNTVLLLSEPSTARRLRAMITQAFTVLVLLGAAAGILYSFVGVLRDGVTGPGVGDDDDTDASDDADDVDDADPLPDDTVDDWEDDAADGTDDEEADDSGDDEENDEADQEKNEQDDDAAAENGEADSQEAADNSTGSSAEHPEDDLTSIAVDLQGAELTEVPLTAESGIGIEYLLDMVLAVSASAAMLSLVLFLLWWRITPRR